jgi:hypothetical protein
MTWHGWIWNTQRQRWEHVCQEEGLSACSKRLGEQTPIANQGAAGSPALPE